MAPFDSPAPILSLNEALAVVAAASVAKLSASQALFKRSSSFSLKSSVRSMRLMFNEREHFSGASFVAWFMALQDDIKTPIVQRRDPAHFVSDEAEAVAIGQALLDYRLAHHISDDHEFENSPSVMYAFVQDESEDVQRMHGELSTVIQNPEMYHQGKLDIRVYSFLGWENWRSCYAVLDDKSAKPRMLRLYKRQSAAGPPFASYAVEECMCSLMECMECKADSYCFTLKAKKQGVSHEEKITLCADHSKRQEGWLSALMDAGVQFIKDDSGTDVVNVKSIFELSARKLRTHEEVPLERFRGKVCVVVNISSKCGITPRDNPQLVKLYNEFKDQGFEILAFPCNQFGSQEPGTETEIEEFVKGYGMTFPIFEKVNVNGPDAHPVWRFLKSQLGGVLGSSIKWNYTKFLIDKNGVPVKRFGPPTSANAMRDDIRELLKA